MGQVGAPATPRDNLDHLAPRRERRLQGEVGACDVILAGFARAGSGSTVIIAGGAGESTAQATSQTLNRFLNRMPSITIREGHRVKVYLTNDLELPAYQVPETRGNPLLAQSAGRVP